MRCGKERKEEEEEVAEKMNSSAPTKQWDEEEKGHTQKGREKQSLWAKRYNLLGSGEIMYTCRGF